MDTEGEDRGATTIRTEASREATEATTTGSGLGREDGRSTVGLASSGWIEGGARRRTGVSSRTPVGRRTPRCDQYIEQQYWHIKYDNGANINLMIH